MAVNVLQLPIFQFPCFLNKQRFGHMRTKDYQLHAESVCNTIHHLLGYMGSAFKECFLIINMSQSWIDDEEKCLESTPHIFK